MKRPIMMIMPGTITMTGIVTGTMTNTGMTTTTIIAMATAIMPS